VILSANLISLTIPALSFFGNNLVSSAVDPFKRFEYEGWEQCVTAYDDGFSKITSVVGDRMLAELGVQPGVSYLDLATGPGHLAARAAALGATSTGVDFSPAMLALAESNYPNLKWILGDVEALHLDDDTFDTVGMNFGIPHLGSPEKAIMEMARVARKSLAFTVWDLPANAQGFEVVLQAIAELGDSTVSLPPGPPFFKFSDTDVAIDAMAAAGVRKTEAHVIPLQWSFGSFSEFFRTFLEGTARTGGLLRAQPEAALRAIRSRVENTVLERFAGVRAPIEIPMSAKLYVGPY